MSYFKRILQDVTQDTNNSSTVNLSVSNSFTFTGIASSTTGISGIQISLYADKKCVVQVQQSNDSVSPVNWDTVYQYVYVSGATDFARTVQATGLWVRCVVTTASETTSTFRFGCALTPIVEAVPASLDENGNFKVAMGVDSYSFDAENTPTGEQRFTEPIRLVGAAFEGTTIDTNFWSTGQSGIGAAISQIGSKLMLTSGTNTSSVFCYSVRRGRYIGGSANRYRSVIQNDVGVSNNTRRWGVAMVSNYSFTITSASVTAGDIYSNNTQYFIILISSSSTTLTTNGTGAPTATGTLTKVSGSAGSPATIAFSANAVQATPTDGAWFQFQNTTFSIVTAVGGVLSTVSSGNFNGNLGYTFSPDTQVQTYEIYYTHSNIYFVIGDTILHTVHAPATEWSNYLSLHVFADSKNSGVASSINMNIRSATLHRLGKENSGTKTYFSTGVVTAQILKYGAGKIHSIIWGGSSVAGSLLVYDALTAVLQIMQLTWPANNSVPSALSLDLDFYNGLTISTTGANTSITIIYE